MRTAHFLTRPDPANYWEFRLGAPAKTLDADGAISLQLVLMDEHGAVFGVAHNGRRRTHWLELNQPRVLLRFGDTVQAGHAVGDPAITATLREIDQDTHMVYVQLSLHPVFNQVPRPA